MSRQKNKFTDKEVKERERIENELSNIPTLHPLAQKISSTEGFIDYYLQMRDLYTLQLYAYEKLEEYHEAITGKRKYSDYDSFREMMTRTLRRQNF